MQKALFMQKQLRVTQGTGVGSHAGSLAMDFGGKDGGRDRCYAPYDCRVVRLREGANGECYIQSLEPVVAANGRVDYQHMLLIHANSFFLKEGQSLRQGEYFYDEGGMKNGNPQGVANHVHVEAGFGASPACQTRNSVGTWVVPNQARIEELLFLPADVDVLDPGGLAWKRAEDVATETGLETPAGMKFRVYQSCFASEGFALAWGEFEQRRAGEPLTQLRLGEDGRYRIYVPVATTVNIEKAKTLCNADRIVLLEA